jgi:capsular polysaccharide biosynthesis protein
MVRQTLSGTVLEQLRHNDLRGMVEGAPRFVRQRLPVSLWPSLVIDPRNRADEVVTLREKPPLSVTYDSAFDEAPPHQMADFLGTISRPENAVYVYHDVDVIGRYPTARIDGKYLLPSWLGVNTPFFLHQQKFLKREVPLTRLLRHAVSDSEPSRHLDTAFLLNDERGSHRYAWLHETLPKLRWFEGYCEATGEDPTLIVNSPLAEFQRQTLALDGVPARRLARTRRGDHPRREAGHRPPPHPAQGQAQFGYATEVGWTGRRIKENLPPVERDFANRVYISREDAHRRHVRNKETVFEALDERGFERYEPGRLSLAEQVKLFASADTFVGFHCPVYFNLMSCGGDTGLLELFAENGVVSSYFVVANELGIDYECLVCEPVHESWNERPANKDVHVDLDRFTERVDSLLGRREADQPSDSTVSQSDRVR